ncbi:MAG: glycosyltransferase involved in cell wall biosynthesis [Flavobacteriaceae bacterium]|jgi:glycosyltransferase involved in cell wall biosynthesis
MNKKKNIKIFLIVTTVPMSLHFFRGQVNILKKEFDVKVASGLGNGLDEFCDSHRVEGFRISKLGRKIAPFKDFISIINLIKIIRKIKPYIVHGNTPKGGLVSMLASWITRTPIRVYCVHGLRYQGTKGIQKKMLMLLEKLSCRLATHVVTVSFGMKKTLRDDSITKKEVHIIWNGSVNGINIEYFSPEVVDENSLREKYNLTKEHIVFGFIGRIVKDKGVNELIVAFLKLNEVYPYTKLLIVGPIEEDNIIDATTKYEIENNPNIVFCGSQKDVRPYLKLMNIFTFPSYREGFGISLMEAAAMNIPAISSNISGCNEIIKDGYNGKLISSKSTVELFNMMKHFVDNPEKVLEMSNVSRQFVIEKYDQKILWDKALKKYLKISGDV